MALRARLLPGECSSRERRQLNSRESQSGPRKRGEGQGFLRVTWPPAARRVVTQRARALRPAPKRGGGGEPRRAHPAPRGGFATQPSPPPLPGCSAQPNPGSAAPPPSCSLPIPHRPPPPATCPQRLCSLPRAPQRSRRERAAGGRPEAQAQAEAKREAAAPAPAAAAPGSSAALRGPCASPPARPAALPGGAAGLRTCKSLGFELWGQEVSNSTSPLSGGCREGPEESSSAAPRRVEPRDREDNVVKHEAPQRSKALSPPGAAGKFFGPDLLCSSEEGQRTGGVLSVYPTAFRSEQWPAPQQPAIS
ncbi:translation initiation factor IF-2-like [Monodelphis domestica]|uniref:translation initiation factor IF-2-like n=1 Tax=Monodelphis domestica TaxID=13616 RepID=UPI0024E1FF7E|nr:translation initiation factor IF-2-like [Monodelphis domestica]